MTAKRYTNDRVKAGDFVADEMLEIHRPQWHNEDLALLCGIANAGGGQLIVGGAESSRARNVRRMYKTFEAIPQLTQQTFGFVCPAEPIMDGPHLCLEIEVPAATEPISFEGEYYLYTSQGNKRLEGKELAEFLSGSQSMADIDAQNESIDDSAAEGCAASAESSEASSATPREANPDGMDAGDAFEPPAKKAPPSANATKTKAAPTFKNRSVAAAKELYLTNTDEYVLKVLVANGRATAPKIASLLGISESTVRRSFRRLKEYGMIERVGSDKAGYWKVNL